MGNIKYLGKDYKSVISKLGIFACSFLVAVVAAYIYSPIVGSHATDNEEIKITVGLNTNLALNIDVNRLDFSFQPSEEGTFLSQPITATVSTNSADGYELYFSSIDDETDMINSFYGVNDVIASDFNGTVTSSTMLKNKWGYSLNNTDFSRIPTLSNQLTVKNINHFPSTAERESIINIGIKVASDIAAGSYEKSVVFSTIAHEDVAKMQDFLCSDLPNIGDTTVLMDARTARSYRVGRLADNQCWMLNDLGFNGRITLTSDDSDLPEGETFTFTDYTLPNGSVYVTFGTATAGWGRIDGNYVDGANSPQSICPKGWRLPTGGPNSDFAWLVETYDTVDKLKAQPFNLNIENSYAMNGDNGSVQDGGLAGFFSSTANKVASGRRYYYMLHVYDYDNDNHENISIGATSSTYGYNVRCIARN